MKEFVNWTEIINYINKVSEFYKNTNITGVYGIPRGRLNICNIIIS